MKQTFDARRSICQTWRAVDTGTLLWIIARNRLIHLEQDFVLRHHLRSAPGPIFKRCAVAGSQYPGSLDIGLSVRAKITPEFRKS